MAQSFDETSLLQLLQSTKHGVPADCAAVRQNFYRVAEAQWRQALYVVRIHRT